MKHEPRLSEAQRWAALARADRDLIVAAVSALPLLLDVVEAAKPFRGLATRWIPSEAQCLALDSALDRLEHFDAR